jgi:predicted transglutaminase-like cysteine proteinase
MNTATKIIAGALAALCMMGTPAAASSSIDLANPAFAPVTGSTSVPVGAAEFCKTNRADCSPSGSVVDAEMLTEASWRQLVAINDGVNSAVAPITDLDQYAVTELWTYPAGRGDCEDYALEKRRQLIAHGWSPSALMMAVVRQQNGDGHAVLMVRTDRGDLVLDNQVGQVLVWKDTSYEFIKRQSQNDPRKWVGITDTRLVLAAR